MADPAPTVLPLTRADKDSESAARRIAQLENTLARVNIELDDLHATLDSVTASGPYKLGRLFAKLYDRVLPLYTRRRLAASVLLDSGSRWTRRLTGKELARVAAHEARDQVAISAADYARWIRKYEPTAAELRRQRRATFDNQPIIGLQLSATVGIEETVRSLQAQTYVRWHLLVVESERLPSATRRWLEERAATDTRILVGRAAADDASYLGRLDAGDTLAPFALFEMVKALNQYSNADFLYSDEDRLDETGQRVDPRCKPDWSPETLRSYNYVGRLAIYRRDLAGRHSDGDYDWALRAAERANQVVHVPYVLYHARTRVRSADGDRRVLATHLERMREPAAVEPGRRPGTFRVRYELKRRPLVSVLVPNRDSVHLLGRCLDSLARATYTRYEVLILENLSTQPETHAYYDWLKRQGRARVLHWDRPFNYAAVNNFGASHARGELLLFLNNDIEAINPDWLECLVAHALRPGVGAVGAKLYYADGTIQHAGIVVGLGGVASHAHVHFAHDAGGYMDQLQVTRNCSAVTAACVMIPAEVFAAVGGFDERFVLAYNDVDLCLRILARGQRMVWTPDAELYHFESKTRGAEDTPAKLARFGREYRLFQRKWADFLKAGDPFYNRNLSLRRTDFALRD
jgi:GT2 family glycosyltransferase